MKMPYDMKQNKIENMKTSIKSIGPWDNLS